MHFTHNMKYLFIAEKPSLMRDVQACYKNHKQEVTERVGEIDFTAPLRSCLYELHADGL